MNVRVLGCVVSLVVVSVAALAVLGCSSANKRSGFEHGERTRTRRRTAAAARRS